MSSADLSDRNERVKQLLLLVWVHGFKGNQASFSDFPHDVSEALQRRYPGYLVCSVIYPKYKTVGELDVATHSFVLWLYTHILELEREEVDKTGQMVHTSVILLGHSMGGMLVADAAREVSENLRQDKKEGRADIKGIIGLDTPFIGIHPALVSYGMEQLDAYIDKTLLDTAAFFGSSPKFIRQGLSKMGIKTPTTSISPISGSTPKILNPDKPVGRLEKGFTSFLSVPGAASSTEWDWTREPGFGLGKVWSEVSGRSSRSSLNGGDVSSRKASETPPLAREGGSGDALTPPVLPPRPGSSAHRARSTGSIALCEAVDPAKEPKGVGDDVEGEDSSAGIPDRAVRSLVESQLQLMGKFPPGDNSESVHQEHNGPLTTGEIPESMKRRSSSGAVSSSVPQTVESEDRPKIEEQSTSGPSDDDTRIARKDDLIATSSNIGTSQSSDVPPPLPKRASHNSRPLDSSSSLLEIDDTSSKSAKSDLSPSISTASVEITAKQKQKKNWRWVKQHTDFMSSCWSVSGIARRMKSIEGMQREGLYFVNIYTTVPPSPGRTFVSLPTIHHPTKESWKPFVHPTAGDQVEAHMALFDSGKNGGYEELIGMLGDEVGMILGVKLNEG